MAISGSADNTTELVPLIDLSLWRSGDPDARRLIAEKVDAALQAVGFLIVTGHGFPAGLIDEVRRVTSDVFALSTVTKLRYHQRGGIGSPGWTPIGAEANAYASGQATPPDLKEAWTVAPVGPPGLNPTSRGVIDVENLFPSEVPEFEPAVHRYLEAGLSLSAELFELLAISADLPPDTFLRQCSHPLHNLNLSWYPPLAEVEGIDAPAPGQYRIGPHCDFGTITILHREPSDPPLQVQLADGTWADLPHVPDSFVVNTGDQLAYWSGGRWRSNPHRIPAPTGASAQIGRTSLVLFVETNVGAMLEPIGKPDDEPMDATEFLIDKLRAIDTALD